MMCMKSSLLLPLCFFLILVGCQPKQAQPPEGAPQHMVTKVEMADLGDALEARRIERIERTCSEGPAFSWVGEESELTLAGLAKGEGFEPCLDLLDGAGKELDEVLFASEANAAAGHSFILAKLNEDLSALAPWREKAAACQSLLPAIAHLGGQASSCSPFVVGKESAPPGAAFRQLRRALTLVLLTADEIEPMKRAEIALAAIRVAQDLSHGGTSLITWAASDRAIAQWLPVLQHLAMLDLSPEQRHALAEGVRALSKNAPKIRKVLEAELDLMVYNTILPVIEGDSYEAPGGFAVDRKEDLFRDPGLVSIGWLAVERSLEELEERCPYTKDLQYCAEQIAQAAHWQKQAKDQRGQAVLDMTKTTLASFEPYIKRAARQEAALAATALWLEKEAEFEPNKSCAELKPQEPELALPSIGGSLVLEELEHAWLLHPPLWLGRGTHPLASMRCPQ